MSRHVASSWFRAGPPGGDGIWADCWSNDGSWDPSNPDWAVRRDQVGRQAFPWAFPIEPARGAGLSFAALRANTGGSIAAAPEGGGAARFARTAAAPLAAAGLAASSRGPSAGASPTAGLSDAGIAADVARYASNGTLGYGAFLTILQDAAVGGMTPSKFGALQTLAGKLNAPGGYSVSPYVRQIAGDVILGNSANATWNGGASTPTRLGNLDASSSQTKVNELTGMWFQGTNLPSLNLSALGEANLNPVYKLSTLPLYGPSGAPSWEDVNQGYLGDCYFVSALGEVALQAPSAIQSMITSNGNGTYGVRFFVNGKPDYVTVNTQLPVMGGGYRWANGSTLEFANGASDTWVALIEKAYAQLNAQTNAPHGMALNSASDSYAGIAAGNGSALTLITGQPESATVLYAGESSNALASILSNAASAFKAGEEVLMSTPGNSSGNLVGGHMYMVTGINAATGALAIQNPWGSAYSGSLAMSFTETIQQLAADNCALWVTSGRPIV
jgi:hypothetical protein